MRFLERNPLPLLLFGTAVGLLLAWNLKAPCLSHEWDGFQYERICYNDLQPLYGHRGLDRDRLPYVQEFNEYPVLTGILMWTAALLSESGSEFFFWNAIFLSLFALGTTYVLWRMVPEKRRVAFWAAGSPLVLYAFHNWDLQAVFFGVLGLHLFKRGNLLGSGFALAAGASAKLFPAFFFPFLALRVLRDEAQLGARTWTFALSFAGGWIAINGPFLFRNPSLFWETYIFHARRLPNFETPWYALGHYAQRWDVAWLSEATAHSALSLATIGVGLLLGGGLALLVWMRRITPEQSAMGALLVFMILNKIFSVQYALWILPFFAMMRISWPKYTLYALGDVLVYITIFPFFLHFEDGGFNQAYDKVAFAVLVRTLSLAWLLGHIYWNGFRGTWQIDARTRPTPAPSA